MRTAHVLEKSESSATHVCLITAHNTRARVFYFFSILFAISTSLFPPLYIMHGSQPIRERVNGKIPFCSRFEYFGVQFFGECWGGPSAGKTFARDGHSDKCWNGVGQQWSNAVYRIEDMPGNYERRKWLVFLSSLISCSTVQVSLYRHSGRGGAWKGLPSPPLHIHTHTSF